MLLTLRNSTESTLRPSRGKWLQSTSQRLNNPATVVNIDKQVVYIDKLLLRAYENKHVSSCPSLLTLHYSTLTVIACQVIMTSSVLTRQETISPSQWSCYCYYITMFVELIYLVKTIAVFLPHPPTPVKELFRFHLNAASSVCLKFYRTSVVRG